jgi:transcriptional regulator with XRE-family HTH domain
MNLGKAIKLCRIQKNIKQSELAGLANISVAYLSLLEQGKRDPSFSTIENIAIALDIPLSIIIFLAADSNNELKDLSPELVDKLSSTALNLMRAAAHGSSTI